MVPEVVLLELFTVFWPQAEKEMLISTKAARLAKLFLMY
jgi:hypothetical protein